jgi:hypothetical protein
VPKMGLMHKNENDPRGPSKNHESPSQLVEAGDGTGQAVATAVMTMAMTDKLVKKIKLYTPESMSSSGSYGLKSVQDVERSTEDEQRMLKGRNAKAEWRARHREPTTKSTAPETISSTPRHAQVAQVDHSSPAAPSRSFTGPGQGTGTITPGAVGCKIHRNSDCDEEECVDDFFEEWDHFEDGVVERTEPRRMPSGFSRPYGIKDEPVAACMDAGRLRGEESRISRFARTRGVRPYLTRAAREFLRHTGDWSGFANYGLCSIILV